MTIVSPKEIANSPPPHLHHEPAQPLPPDPALQLDLIHVEDLVVAVHVVAEVGEAEGVARGGVAGDQVPINRGFPAKIRN